MCRLNNAINTFKENNRGIIDESKLVYDWNGWDDESTNKLFDLFKEDLRAALACRTDDGDLRVKRVIRRILSWGGIKKITDKTMNDYIGALKALERGDEWSEDTITISKDHPVVSENNMPSWTKILSAYKDDYCIYDARVAVALRIVCPDKKWFLPHLSATNNKKAKVLIRYFGHKKQLTPQESYDEYLIILQETHAPVKYERTLFMIIDSLQIIKEHNAQKIVFIGLNNRKFSIPIPPKKQSKQKKGGRKRKTAKEPRKALRKAS